MAEQVESICIPFTHTYDQFTTFFYDGRVYLSDTSYPIGQCCVEIANMDEEVLSEIDRRVEEFIPAAQAAALEKDKQRCRLRAKEAERCLGYHFYHAGVP